MNSKPNRQPAPRPSSNRLIKPPNLDALKQQCPLPVLMKHLGLEQHARPSSKSPFRNDDHASWGIFQTDLGWRFKDHGTGEGGDEITFLATHLNLDQQASFPSLLGIYQAVAQKVAATKPQTKTPVASPPAEPVDLPTALPDRTGFGPGTDEQRRQLAELRGFTEEAIAWAIERGVLVFGGWHGNEYYGICDQSGLIVEIRRLDGSNFPAGGNLQERKSHALRHSQKNWPVGLLEAQSASNILLVEGVPDFIAAHEVILVSQLQQQWAPVAMLSAAAQISRDALPHFIGKHVRIFYHHDASQQGYQAALKWHQQLRTSGNENASLFDTRKLSNLRACLKTRPVRAPGLQATGFSAKYCRPRALTRRFPRVFKHALSDGGIKDLNDYLRCIKAGQHPGLPALTGLLNQP